MKPKKTTSQPQELEKDTNSSVVYKRTHIYKAHTLLRSSIAGAIETQKKGESVIYIRIRLSGIYQTASVDI